MLASGEKNYFKLGTLGTLIAFRFKKNYKNNQHYDLRFFELNTSYIIIMGVVGIIFLRGGGLGEGAFRRSTTFGFSCPPWGSCASCPRFGDSVYQGYLRGGWGSVVRMTPFGPFYCLLPLYPQPKGEGGLVIKRKRALTGTADEIMWGWFVWANAPTTSAVLGFLSVGAAYLRPCLRVNTAAKTRPSVRDTFPSENLKAASVCVRLTTSATTPTLFRRQKRPDGRAPLRAQTFPSHLPLNCTFHAIVTFSRCKLY